MANSYYGSYGVSKKRAAKEVKEEVKIETAAPCVEVKVEIPEPVVEEKEELVLAPEQSYVETEVSETSEPIKVEVVEEVTEEV